MHYFKNMPLFILSASTKDVDPSGGLPMTSLPFYPPAPTDIPARVTGLGNAYRLRVLAMIGGLFVFLALYLVFIALSGLLARWLFFLPIPDVGGRGVLFFLVLKFGGAFAALLLWLFLLKGLFKRQTIDRSTYVLLKEPEHPRLFEFISRIRRDIGAPRPRHVYASPEVNAALIYSTSLLNLFIPPRKDLLIGLGLVNTVNLSEFKAILAHEFGHFAQRSVGLGSYVFVANRVMHDVIYSRDGLDQFVEDWSRQDFRIAFPAWGLKAILFVAREVLAGTYKAINVIYLSLGRQMEFNADNVAVSVTGSDAIIHGLSRLKFASECLADTAQSLAAAADGGLFTDDVFFHQTQAAARLRRQKEDESLGLPPVLPEDTSSQVQVFQPEDDGIPDKYRTHPTHYMRERNAKRHYVRSPLDDRSPWLLFEDASLLKRRVTEVFYRQSYHWKGPYDPRPAAEIQKFIDAEHAEITHDPKYHGLYDDRFINPGEIADGDADAMPFEQAAIWLAVWPEPDLKKKVETYRKLQEEHRLLGALKSGKLVLKERTFSFRNQDRTAADVIRLFDQVGKELDAEIESLNALDRRAYLAHRSLASRLDGAAGGPRDSELLTRYRFHMSGQRVLLDVLGQHSRFRSVLQFISQKPVLEEQEFHSVRKALGEIRRTIDDRVEETKSIKCPELTNISAGATLHSLISDRDYRYLMPFAGDRIPNEWLEKLSTRVEGVLARSLRVYFKSLGGLLACQERLTVEWTDTQL